MWFDFATARWVLLKTSSQSGIKSIQTCSYKLEAAQSGDSRRVVERNNMCVTAARSLRLANHRGEQPADDVEG